MTQQGNNGKWQNQTEAKCPGGEQGPPEPDGITVSVFGHRVSAGAVPRPSPLRAPTGMASDTKQKPRELRHSDFNQKRHLQNTWEGQTSSDLEATKMIPVLNSTFPKK